MLSNTTANAQHYRQQLPHVNRWVIKIGSAMLTQNGQGIDPKVLSQWAGQIATLQRANKQVLLVSSGAIAIGMGQLNWHTRPTELSQLQTAAAVGQMQLSHAWQEAFATHGIRIAQVLLTHDDAADRQRYLNIRSSLQTMCQLNIIPVINENDTVSYAEIRFGDNDNLGAMVANVVSAGAYLILTDQQGLYDKNPRQHSDAQLIPTAYAHDPALLDIADSKGGALGSGGMLTKILAAQKAAHSGTHTLLASGAQPDIITRLSQGEPIGTLLIAHNSPQQARKQWLGSQLQIAGQLWLDHGASQALISAQKSLLPVGVTQISGHFARGELVACLNPQGKEIARGLINYDAQETQQLIGKHSHELTQLLIHGDTLIHRDNLILTPNAAHL